MIKEYCGEFAHTQYFFTQQREVLNAVEKMIMKKILTILLCVICLFLFGCNEDKADVEEYADKEIKDVIVYYDKGSLLCSVWLHMDTGERTITIHSEPKKETTDTYGYVDELDVFFKDNILTEHNTFSGEEKGHGDQDEHRELWSIRITFSDSTFLTLSSTTQYPQQWDEFVELIEK